MFVFYSEVCYNVFNIFCLEVEKMEKLIEDFIERKNKQIEEKNALLKQAEDEMKREQRERIEKEKQLFLLEHGIYKIAYSPAKVWTQEYPESTYDPITGKYTYYKHVFPEISDEEFEKLKELQEKTEMSKEELARFKKSRQETKSEHSVNTSDNSDNTPLIYKVLIWIATGTFVVGVIAAFAILFTWLDDYALSDYALEAFFVCLNASFIEGALFWGFAEVIKLLNDIKNK